MFSTVEFGKGLSTLRKAADMTQNDLADRLYLSRQAISKYERGESFPDISILSMIAEIFDLSLDELIRYGEPTDGESAILKKAATGKDIVTAETVSDVVNLAPLLKPSLLTELSEGFSNHGINITDIVVLAEYLNDDTVLKLIETTSFESISDDVMDKFLPLLNNDSKESLFQKILTGELDWHYIKQLLPYADFLVSRIEAAVVAGVLPEAVLDILQDYYPERN